MSRQFCKQVTVTNICPKKEKKIKFFSVNLVSIPSKNVYKKKLYITEIYTMMFGDLKEKKKKLKEHIAPHL